VDSQGPECPELIEYIKDNKDNYDVFVFMTYLYYTTVRGIAEVADKAILIPTAHDEPTIYYNVYKDVFTKPAGLFYCTEIEKNFVENKFHNENIINNGGFGGAGIELPCNIKRDEFKNKNNISNYIVYVGRIDTHKGCHYLFDYFTKYKRENDNGLKLVLIGKSVMDIPDRNDIINLGFVSDEVKYNVMAGADALVLPSEFESLSIVVLESLALGVPVIVNGKCEVLKQHCVISRAGTYYTNYDEFAKQLNDMICDSKMREDMGKHGVQYVDQYYRWDKIIDSFSQMVEKVSDKAGKKE
ncbi:MAG: glycosyltransferase family 4 protein, partial [Lachnospira sp.]|nr:glycosyltransferase family 4 protein [Lachnospira sp.]